jgi:predicted RNase H-like nuclease (RuvC/YqgF family)
MAIPLLVAGLMTAGGLVGGALLRQPEIERLKAQVKLLQNEIKRLQSIIEEQQRQIVELRLRYDTINFLRFFEKQRIAADIKGNILYLCSFKEYIALSMRRSKGEKLHDQQQKFLHAYEMLTTGNDTQLTEEDYDCMVDYIENKYSDTIENMSTPSLKAELLELEQY